MACATKDACQANVRRVCRRRPVIRPSCSSHDPVLVGAAPPALVPHQAGPLPETGQIDQLHHRPVLAHASVPQRPHGGRSVFVSTCTRSCGFTSTPSTVTSGRSTSSAHLRVAFRSTRALDSEGCRNRQIRGALVPRGDLHPTRIPRARLTHFDDTGQTTEFEDMVDTFLAWSDEIMTFPEPAASRISNGRLEGTNNSRFPDATSRLRVLQPNQLRSPRHPRLRSHTVTPTETSSPHPMDMRSLSCLKHCASVELPV